MQPKSFPGAGAALRGLLLACLTVSACSYSPTAPPPPDPSVTLSTSMSTLALTQGDTGSIDVTIARNGGFAGPVTLAASGAPAGVAVEAAENPVAGISARLRVSVASATTPGTYPLVLTATGDGISAQTLPLELDVMQLMPQSVTVGYCAGLEPSWVAFQDGNGAWTRVESTTAGATITFSADFSTNRGAVATVYRYAEFTSVVVWYGTPEELAAVGDTNPRYCGPATSKTVYGSVAGLGTNEFAVVSAGSGARVRAFPEQGGDFVLYAVPSGPQDLLATRNLQVDDGDTVIGMILRRGIEVADGGSLPTFDFAAPEAFAPAVANVTIEGLGPGGASGSTSLLTSNDDLPVSRVTTPETDATRHYLALPETQLLPGDLQALFVTASPAGTADGRTASVYFHAPTDRTLALGAPLMPPTFTTVATEPALRMRARFVSQSDYDRSAGVSFQQGAGTTFSVNMTASYAALAGGGYDIVMPDLSQVEGFDPAWALRPEGTLIWVAGRIGGTLGLGPNAVPSDGTTRRTTAAAGTIPVP
jgi:hypothetical protein